MQYFNICGNNDTSKFDMYWKSAIRAMETESAHGVHERRHAASDSYSTNRISHSPFMSTNHLIKSTIKLLKKDGLKKYFDFKVLSKSWVSLQFTSNNGQQLTAYIYTGLLPFFHALQTLELYNDHPHGITMQR